MHINHLLSDIDMYIFIVNRLQPNLIDVLYKRVLEERNFKIEGDTQKSHFSQLNSIIKKLYV